MQQTLKDFLASPPSVIELVFERHAYPSDRRSGGTGTMVFIADNRPVYSAVLDANGFVIEHLRSSGGQAADLMAGQEPSPDWVVGATSEKAWRYQIERQINYFPGKLRESDNGVAVHDFVRRQRSVVLEAVHLGIAYLKPGSLRWNGNYWSGDSTLGTEIRGQAWFDTATKKLQKIEYKLAGVPNAFRIECDYSDQTPEVVSEGFPLRFRRIQLSAEAARPGELVEADFKILRIALNNHSDAERISGRLNSALKDAAAHGILVFEETEAGVQNVSRMGSAAHFRKVRSNGKVTDDFPISSLPNPRSRAVVLVLCLTGSVGLWLVWKTNKSRKTTSQ